MHSAATFLFPFDSLLFAHGDPHGDSWIDDAKATLAGFLVTVA